MKKIYDKPMLMMLSLSGNEQLCGSCRDAGADILLYQRTDIANALLFFTGDSNNNGPDRTDFVSAFGSEDGCSSSIVEGYCKFTGTTTVAWS